ncbi:MAG: DUF4956 domain-containing protein [Caldicoprobacterales bacterium]|jgi:hypothetical protein|nr:DUF4956 domain-containing protein [Clostridiales bacterium]
MWNSVLETFFITWQEIIYVLVSLVLSVLMGAVTAIVYKLTHRGMNYEPSFVSTLVALSPIVAMVMLLIQGNLVLSLGLVGSLSIIRFRTPVKDTRDMVFLFWSIATGLGCGTHNWTVTLILTALIAIVMCVLYLMRAGSLRHKEFVLVISGTKPFQSENINELIRRHNIKSQIRTHEIQDDQWEIIYEMKAVDMKQGMVEALIEDINSLEGVSKVSVLAPQLALPL